mmetsp:Transcript_36361/g.60250  ORF Transcript_36361/g.60250 Transcript_36361/m.60250 type:complete len:336 (+) Transcript_36361:285-1292(+)
MCQSRRSAHETRVHSRCGLSMALTSLYPPCFSHEHDHDGMTVRAQACEGLAILRGNKWCSPALAAQVYAALDSDEAQALSWTALRDGGNSNGLDDTVKCYCGELDAMLARGGRYRQQLLVRGRRCDPLLRSPAIIQVRKAVMDSLFTLIEGSAAELCTPGSSTPMQTLLLTEQLIKYLPTDRWFAPHFDKDRRDTTHEPLDPKAYDGPGDAIAALCLGCPCTLLMIPRAGGAGAFAVDLLPGDVYILAGASRWEWKHGLSVADDEHSARRAIVWRVILEPHYQFAHTHARKPLNSSLPVPPPLQMNASSSNMLQSIVGRDRNRKTKKQKTKKREC